MPGLDDSKPFVPLGIAVLTVSDTRSTGDDKSGATLAERIAKPTSGVPAVPLGASPGSQVGNG